jgi:twitching motility protein PilT
MTLIDLLEIMVRGRASDLFLKVGAEPAFRVDGAICRDLLPAPERGKLDASSVQEVCNTVFPDRLLKRFDETGEADAAYEVPRLGRFRVNVFRQMGKTGVVFRHLPKHVPTFEELHLPAAQLKKLCAMQRGLVLITGIAGSGKSTCLASMVDYINTNYPRHIITVEDPIEFVHEDKMSLVEQREVGSDTQSFASALKYSLRQSPDVILIGEMRDQETMEAALNAAETGHLVLSTLHTVNAVQTVERIMGYFPPHLHALVRMQLALVLEGAISMRLLKRKDRPGRVPAVEVLLATPSVRELLDQGKTRQLPAALRDGDYFGTITFGQALKGLLDNGLITQEDALAAADNPEELRMELKGIVRGGNAHRLK